MTRPPTLRRRRRRDKPRDPAREARLVATLLASLFSLAGGCRSYERRPLDMAAAREAWLARSPLDETVRQFAHRLAEQEGRAEPAAPFNPNDGLTLAEAEVVALVFNRDLRLARQEADVLRATADNAGRWDDPVFALDLERVLASIAEPWIVATTIGLTIPISGRLGAERARAGAVHAAELQRLAAKEWSVRTLLRETWIEWSAFRLREEMADELVGRLGVVAGLADRQEQAGALSRIEARLFHVELAVAKAECIAASTRTKELELELCDLLGLSSAAPLQLVESMTFPARDDAASFLAAMEVGNLDLAAARSEYEVAEQSLRLEMRRQYPDLGAGPGYATEEGEDRLRLGLQVPIPLWNRNRQGVAAASAERDAARVRFETTYERLTARLVIARTRCEAGRAMREAVESQVVPLADEQDADVRRIAELGRVDPLLLLEAIKARHEAKLRLVDARADEALAAIRLEELVGPPTATKPSSADEGGRP